MRGVLGWLIVSLDGLMYLPRIFASHIRLARSDRTFSPHIHITPPPLTFMKVRSAPNHESSGKLKRLRMAHLPPIFGCAVFKKFTGKAAVGI